MFVHSFRPITAVGVLALTLAACGGAPTEETTDSDSVTAAVLPHRTSIEIQALQDARTQQGSADRNFGAGILWTNTVGHQSFVEFDLSVVPAEAIIESAELKLYFNGNYPGTNTVEVGAALDAWEESTLTWNNQPAVDWSGPQQDVGDTAGDVVWDVTDLVTPWHEGSSENHGFALRSPAPGGKQYRSRESAQSPPRLVITYVVPVPVGPQPDLGHAPDSSNHHGIANTAYAAGAVPGDFPTVWQVPMGAAAGPKHENQTLQGFLGNFISRELEADLGPDADGPNNILRNAAGMVGDFAGNDRGDDGWQNPNTTFFNCMKQTLNVRVNRPLGAVQQTMYLNIWRDGNRDGDWSDTGPCAISGPAPVTNYEWIVQNYVVDMTAIAPGTFADLAVDTQRVLSIAAALPAWMRFTLSERPAVAPPAGGLPDGRGPHPLSPAKSFKFGETEDFFHVPPPPGEPGELVLEKRVLNANGVVPQGGVVTYELRLRHEGGSAPVAARLRDPIIGPQHPISGITVTTPTGGAAPLFAGYQIDPAPPPPAPFGTTALWDGLLAPDAEVRLRFDVHVHPTCSPLQTRKVVTNVAEAQAVGGDVIEATASFTADCPGEGPTPHPIDFDVLDHIPASQILP